MKLKDYLEMSGLTGYRFWQLLNTKQKFSKRLIYDYIEERVVPTKKTAHFLEMFTGGKITMKDLRPDDS